MKRDEQVLWNCSIDIFTPQENFKIASINETDIEFILDGKVNDVELSRPTCMYIFMSRYMYARMYIVLVLLPV